jgi:hypothetical protein
MGQSAAEVLPPLAVEPGLVAGAVGRLSQETEVPNRFRTPMAVQGSGRGYPPATGAPQHWCTSPPAQHGRPRPDHPVSAATVATLNVWISETETEPAPLFPIAAASRSVVTATEYAITHGPTPGPKHWSCGLICGPARRPRQDR